jgi:hypothetical protein
LTTSAYGRKEVAEFCEKVSDVGDIAIFGGMLRDLLLEGNAKFRSDVDLVIDTDELSSLEQVIRPYAPHRTAFGGYRVVMRRWIVDLWPLSCTWAIRTGHVKGSTFSDLTRTTFFNWDAVVYELRSGVVHWGAHYVPDLQSRLLAINLAPNPNPEGAAIRALRMALTKQARLSFDLAEYTADVFETVGVDALIESERQKHRPVRVTAEVMIQFLEYFKIRKAAGNTSPIALTAQQFELELPHKA